MSNAALLAGKRAVIFGAGGSIGAAVAYRLAGEGAEVFLAGRTRSTLEAVQRRIDEAGGRAQCAEVDALDEDAVNTYLDGVVARAGGFDIALNAVGPRPAAYGNGKPAVDLPVAEFLVAQTVLTSQFLTARSAAQRMVKQGSGVVVFLTGSPARPHSRGAAGIGAAFGGIEVLTRTMALELSGTGVRIVCLRTAANRDTRTIRDTVDILSTMTDTSSERLLASFDEHSWLRTGPRTADTADAAVLLASDLARMMTGTVHNVTAGVCTD